MDALKALAYIVALIVILAVSHRIAPNSTPPRQGIPHSIQYEGLRYMPSRPTCPTTNTTDTAVYLVDFLKVVGGVDYEYVANPNLSNINVTGYLIEYAKLGLSLSSIMDNGTTYRLTMLPIDEGDRLGLLNKSIYMCFPPKARHPLFTIRNLTDSSVVVDNSTYTVINAATPPPYAELSNLAISRTVLEAVLVEGYGEALTASLSHLGSYTYGPYCWEWMWGDHTYEYCYSHAYNRYRASWSYIIGYAVNGSVAYSRTVGSAAELEGGGSGARVISSDFEGHYMGFGPLTKVEVTAHNYVDRSGGCSTGGNRTECHYHYEHGVSSIAVNVYTRGLRIDTKVNASIGLEAVPVTGVEPVNISTQKYATLEPRGSVSLPVSFSDSVDVCNYIEVEGDVLVRCLGRAARNSFTGYVDLAYRVREFEWPWGSVVDAPYEITVEKKLYPPPYAPDTDLNKLFYGYLQEAVLKYVAGVVDGYASQTGYRSFEAWALATQIPIQMEKCGNRTSYMPLLEALQNGCGSNEERAEILSGMLKHLGIEHEVKDVTVKASRGMGIAEVPGIAVYGHMGSYPGFYNLTGLGCASEAEEGYMIAYDTAQNNIFSDLRKIIINS
ncbi:MAG: hypothetical protein QXS42_00515 [Zestosphaera sp.]